MKYWIIILLCLIVAGCQGSYALPDAVPADDEAEALPVFEPDEPADDSSVEPVSEPDVYTLRPNEVGKTMVLMYHEVGGTESTWRRTAENFRNDLETLHQEGYRPVNLNDYLWGNIDIPAGTSPVILTFDDGTGGQFRFFEEDGQSILDPDCAVAIILQMAAKYEDFDPAGTFYIYYPLPFRQKDLIADKLELLTAWGFEIGNHTYGHENLAKLSVQDAVKTLAGHVRATQNYLPLYNVNTLALPYGAMPKDDSHLRSGSWEGVEYQHEAILLVGANPARSPFDRQFNPLRLPRVRADGTELYRWLEYFRNNPEERYISDGDPDSVTIPESLTELVDENRLQGRILRTY